MTAHFPDKHKPTATPSVPQSVDPSELADRLDFAKAALGSSTGLPEETRRELETSLDDAETVLRSAAAEDTILVRIKSLFSEG